MSQPHQSRSISFATELLDLRDDLAIARDLVACVWLAAQAPTIVATERSALCAASNVAREKLEAACTTLDGLVVEASKIKDVGTYESLA